MEGIDLLEHWKKFVNASILQTWSAFSANKRILLTESDLKCNLYLHLHNQALDYQYAIHTEVTHFHTQEGHEEKKYRFRDIALLNPQKIKLNEEIWASGHTQLSKGFKHKGEAVFIELKFKRQPIYGNQYRVFINDADIQNLRTYKQNKKTPKMIYLIWGSHVDVDFADGVNHSIKGQMLKALSDFTKEPYSKFRIPPEHVLGFVFGPNELWEVKWEDDQWKPNKVGYSRLT